MEGDGSFNTVHPNMDLYKRTLEFILAESPYLLSSSQNYPDHRLNLVYNAITFMSDGCHPYLGLLDLIVPQLLEVPPSDIILCLKPYTLLTVYKPEVFNTPTLNTNSVRSLKFSFKGMFRKLLEFISKLNQLEDIKLVCYNDISSSPNQIDKEINIKMLELLLKNNLETLKSIMLVNSLYSDELSTLIDQQPFKTKPILHLVRIDINQYESFQIKYQLDNSRQKLSMKELGQPVTSTQNGFSNFPKIPTTIDTQSIYDYRFRIFFDHQKDVDEDKRNMKIFFNGSPGIGKSMFAIFLIGYFRSLKDVSVIYHYRSMDEFYYFTYMDNDPVAYIHPISFFPRLLPMLYDQFDSRIIYITDGISPKALDIKCFSILISSPKYNISKNFLKSFPRPITRYIPLWTFDEYLQASSLYSKTEVYIKEAYSIAGGSARLVFHSDSIELLKQILLQAVNRTNIDECWKAIGSVGSNDEASSVVFNMDVENYIDFSYKFASNWVAQQVMTKKLINTSLPLSNFFNSTNEALNQIVGQLYEAYIIQSFLQSKDFKIISKVNKSIKTIHTPGGSVPFSSFDDWSLSDTLYVPTSISFATIDFLLTPGSLFLIKKTKDHKLVPASDIQKYINKLQTIQTPQKNDPLDIYLISVVPSNKIEYLNPLNYNEPGCHFQEFELKNRITQWMCILPYPTILDLKNLESN
eukprot:gene6725-8337_t